MKKFGKSMMLLFLLAPLMIACGDTGGEGDGGDPDDPPAPTHHYNEWGYCTDDDCDEIAALHKEIRCSTFDSIQLIDAEVPTFDGEGNELPPTIIKRTLPFYIDIPVARAYQLGFQATYEAGHYNDIHIEFDKLHLRYMGEEILDTEYNYNGHWKDSVTYNIDLEVGRYFGYFTLGEDCDYSTVTGFTHSIACFTLSQPHIYDSESDNDFTCTVCHYRNITDIGVAKHTSASVNGYNESSRFEAEETRLLKFTVDESILNKDTYITAEYVYNYTIKLFKQGATEDDFVLIDTPQLEYGTNNSSGICYNFTETGTYYLYLHNNLTQRRTPIYRLTFKDHRYHEDDGYCGCTEPGCDYWKGRETFAYTEEGQAAASTMLRSGTNNSNYYANLTSGNVWHFRSKLPNTLANRTYRLYVTYHNMTNGRENHYLTVTAYNSAHASLTVSKKTETKDYHGIIEKYAYYEIKSTADGYMYIDMQTPNSSTVSVSDFYVKLMPEE